MTIDSRVGFTVEVAVAIDAVDIMGLLNGARGLWR